MDIRTYAREAARTLADLPVKSLDNTHMLLGMVTEVGELADVFKKDLAYGKEIDWVNVREEVGDLMWYIANFCTVNGFDLEEVLQTNIDKLRARYPEKFTQEKATSRDLQKERSILEREWDTNTITIKDTDLKIYPYVINTEPE